jgi:hypothetical protein
MVTYSITLTGVFVPPVPVLPPTNKPRVELEHPAISDLLWVRFPKLVAFPAVENVM